MKFGAVKGFVDGVVESKTAAMLEPYAGGGGAASLNWTRRGPGPHGRRSTTAKASRSSCTPSATRPSAPALDAYERAAKDERHLRAAATASSTSRSRRAADIARFKPLGRDRLHAGPVREPGPEHARGLRGHPRPGSRVAGHGLPLPRRGGRRAGLRQRLARLLHGGPARHLLRGRRARRRRARPPAAGSRTSGSRPKPPCATSRATPPTRASRSSGRGRWPRASWPTSSSSPTTSWPPPPERILKTQVLLTVMGGRDTYRAGDF